jgi:hypothetical protein
MWCGNDMSLDLNEEVQGLFKKRPNYLNSAPISIESPLRLLSASSVRCWLQTAVRPVSLWALVVELHLLYWARAQAIRRISDKVTMKELEEQRVYVKFCCKLGKNLQRHFSCLTKHTGKESPRPKRQGWVGQRSRCCWLCFFFFLVIVHHEFLLRSHMVNKQLYQKVLARLRDAVRRKSTIILNIITLTHRWNTQSGFDFNSLK